MTTTIPVTGVTPDGQQWTLLGEHPNSYSGRPLYRILLNGEERWSDLAIGKQIRMQIDPAYAAEQHQIARQQAEEQAAAELAAQRRNRLRAECEETGRRVFVRFGYARSGFRSTNYRDNRMEDGTSVYPAWVLPGGDVVLDLVGIDLASYLFGGFGHRQAYVALGRPQPVGTGSDGEPLLDRFALKKINPANVEYVH